MTDKTGSKWQHSRVPTITAEVNPDGIVTVGKWPEETTDVSSIPRPGRYVLTDKATGERWLYLAGFDHV